MERRRQRPGDALYCSR